MEYKTPLILTKLNIPRTSGDLVERPRLLDKLNQRLKWKVILITIPVGFGKTTLAETWLRSKNEGKRQKVERNKTVHLSVFSPLPFGLA